MPSDITFNLDKSKICYVIKESPFPKQALDFMCMQHKSCENTVGNGEIAHNEQFLIFPSLFYFFAELLLNFIKFQMVICNNFQFGRIYSLSFGKRLNKEK